MNSKAIADALAARFAGVTATVGSVTESLTMATASLPNTVGRGPALLVYHPTAALDVIGSQLRQDVLTFPVRLLRDPENYPSRSDWLYAWYDALRDRVEQQLSLGLPAYVLAAQPVAARVELDGEEYAGTTYDVVEFMVNVELYENVPGVAA